VFIIYLRDEFEKKVKTMMVNNYTYIKTNNRTSPKKTAAYDVVNPGWVFYSLFLSVLPLDIQLSRGEG
jgi:hypothetical protein